MDWIGYLNVVLTNLAFKVLTPLRTSDLNRFFLLCIEAYLTMFYIVYIIFVQLCTAVHVYPSLRNVLAHTGMWEASLRVRNERKVIHWIRRERERER
jgi:hypothetical protein